MSMQSYPEYGIGFVLTSGYGKNSEDEIQDLVESFGFDDVYELVEAQEDSDHCWRFYDSDMEGKSFHPFVENEDAEEEPQEMLVIWALKQPEPFAAVYTPEEIKKEFQDILKDNVPEDFNWDAHIGYFSCTVYC